MSLNTYAFDFPDDDERDVVVDKIKSNTKINFLMIMKIKTSIRINTFFAVDDVCGPIRRVLLSSVVRIAGSLLIAISDPSTSNSLLLRSCCQVKSFYCDLFSRQIAIARFGSTSKNNDDDISNPRHCRPVPCRTRVLDIITPSLCQSIKPSIDSTLLDPVFRSQSISCPNYQATEID